MTSRSPPSAEVKRSSSRGQTTRSLSITPRLAWVTIPVAEGERMIELNTRQLLDHVITPAEDTRISRVMPLTTEEEEGQAATEFKRAYSGLILTRDKSGAATLRYAVPYPTWTPSHSLVVAGDVGTWTSYITLPGAIPDFGPMDRVTFVHQEATDQPEPVAERKMAKASALMAAGSAPASSPRGEFMELAVTVDPKQVRPGVRTVVEKTDATVSYLTTFRVPHMMAIGDTPLPTRANIIVHFEAPVTIMPGRVTIVRGEQAPTVAQVEGRRTKELRLRLGPDPDVTATMGQSETVEGKTERVETQTIIFENTSKGEKNVTVMHRLTDQRLIHHEPAEGASFKGNDIVFDLLIAPGRTPFSYTLAYAVPEATRVILGT